MIRIVLLNILLLILPTVLYVAYIHLTAPEPALRLGQILDRAPLPWLLTGGALLALTVLVLFASPPEGRPGDTYTPPEFRDGVLVPGTLGDKPTDHDDAAKTN